jgi:hypothetical protein
MANASLVTPFVTPDLAWGEAILAALDVAKFPVTAALWLLQNDDKKWELVIATPLYDKLAQRNAYMRLIEALKPTGNVFLGGLPLRLESNKHPLIRTLRKIFGRAASVEGMRLGLSIGNVWVQDGYVYRIKP